MSDAVDTPTPDDGKNPIEGKVSGSEFDDDTDFLGVDEGFVGEDTDEEGSTLALFQGDTGGLSHTQRRALVVLLKNRFISAGQNPTEWRVVRDDPMPIKARSNDMFLDLHLDLHHEVAFKRQAVSDSSGREFPTGVPAAPVPKRASVRA